MFFGGIILLHIIGLFFFGDISALWSAAGELIFIFWHEENSLFMTNKKEKNAALKFLIVLGFTAGSLFIMHLILVGIAGEGSLDDVFRNLFLG